MISPYKALWESRMRDIWVMPGTKINAMFRNGETYSAELTSDIEEQIEQQKYDLAFLPIQEVSGTNYMESNDEHYFISQETSEIVASTSF